MRYDEPVYLISIVAKILSIHPQTLRQYEKEGFIEPNRTGGKVRMYSQKDIDRIKTIMHLTRDMGVNLAGVDVILRLQEQLEEANNLIYELRLEMNKDKPNQVVKRKDNFNVVFYDKK